MGKMLFSKSLNMMPLQTDDSAVFIVNADIFGCLLLKQC